MPQEIRLMGFLARTWQWVKSIFLPGRRRQFADIDEMFVPIDVDAVREELRLDHDAVRFGENELPASDDVELDGPHKRIRQHISEVINDAFRRANTEIERLDAALRRRDLGHILSKIRELPAETEAPMTRRTTLAS